MGSDGQVYRWSWRSTAGEEWTVGLPQTSLKSIFDPNACEQCTNANNHHVASYSLKVPGEPEYNGSSGCVLAIEEAYPHLATGMISVLNYPTDVDSASTEMLASLTIMRYIVALNL